MKMNYCDKYIVDDKSYDYVEPASSIDHCESAKRFFGSFETLANTIRFYKVGRQSSRGDQVYLYTTSRRQSSVAVDVYNNERGDDIVTRAFRIFSLSLSRKIKIKKILMPF